MPEIILTEEQTRKFSEARDKVVFRDPLGNIIGVVDPNDAIALARHRLRAGQPAGPGIPGQKVTELLKALQAEWERTGGFDVEYMESFLAKLREAEAK